MILPLHLFSQIPSLPEPAAGAATYLYGRAKERLIQELEG